MAPPTAQGQTDVEKRQQPEELAAPLSKKFSDHLHNLMKYVKEHNLTDVVSYAPGNDNGFIIHNKTEFAKTGGLMEKFSGYVSYDAFITDLMTQFTCVGGVECLQEETVTFRHPFFKKPVEPESTQTKVVPASEASSKRPPVAVSPVGVVEAPKKRQKIGLTTLPVLIAAAEGAAAATATEPAAATVVTAAPPAATVVAAEAAAAATATEPAAATVVAAAPATIAAPTPTATPTAIENSTVSPTPQATFQGSIPAVASTTEALMTVTASMKVSERSSAESDTSGLPQTSTVLPNGQKESGGTLPVSNKNENRLLQTSSSSSSSLPAESTNGSDRYSTSNLDTVITQTSQMVSQQIASMAEQFLQATIASISRECSKKIAMRNEEVTKLRLQLLESQQRERVTQERAQAAKDVDVTELRDELLKQRSANSKLEKEISGARNDQDKTQKLLLEMKTERDSARAELSKNMDRISVMVEESESIRQELSKVQNERDIANSRLFDVQSEYDSARAELSEVISLQQQELEEHKTRHNTQRLEVDALRSSHRRNVDGLKSKYQEEVARLKKLHTEEIERIQTRHNDELNKIRNVHKHELGRSIKDAASVLDAGNAARRQHEDEVKKLTSDNKAVREERDRSEYAKCMEKLDAVKNKHDSTLSEVGSDPLQQPVVRQFPEPVIADTRGTTTVEDAVETAGDSEAAGATVVHPGGTTATDERTIVQRSSQKKRKPITLSRELRRIADFNKPGEGKN